MKLYYQESDGQVIEIRMDWSAENFDPAVLSDTENMLTYEIDEIPENRAILRKIWDSRYGADDTGLIPLFVDQGELYTKGFVHITPVVDQDRELLRAQFQNAVDTLTQIKDAPSLTSAQVINAVQYEATVLLNILKLIKKKFS